MLGFAGSPQPTDHESDRLEGPPLCAPQLAGNRQGHLQRLFIIEAWVYLGFVGPFQPRLIQATGATDTLGHIIPGQFKVDAAEDTALALMDRNRLLQFAEDIVKTAGL